MIGGCIEISGPRMRAWVQIRDVNLKIAFVIKGGKARKAEVSPQRRLHISTSAFL